MNISEITEHASGWYDVSVVLMVVALVGIVLAFVLSRTFDGERVAAICAGIAIISVFASVITLVNASQTESRERTEMLQTAISESYGVEVDPGSLGGLAYGGSDEIVEIPAVRDGSPTELGAAVVNDNFFLYEKVEDDYRPLELAG